MATQRITIAKIGGLSADVILRRFQEWAAARQASDATEWSADQWPSKVRCHVDVFAERLKSNALSPPVIHFVEWSDLWSMGDMFGRWLTPPDCPRPTAVHTDRFEMYVYALPDGGCLAKYLANTGPQQFEEYDCFVRRLLEAIAAWQGLVDKATLVVLREVAGGLVTDDEFTASLSLVPDWISES